MQNTICCYTAITGGYDNLNEPTFITPGIDYICFTDGYIKSNSIWQFRPIPEDLLNLSLVKQQRILKICPHRYLPEYDTSIWVDGNILIKGDLNKFLSEYDLNSYSLYTRIHPKRDCIYDEALAVKAMRKDISSVVDPIIARYKAENYPSHAGLVETCIIIRKHNDIKCVLFDNAWATELLLHSHRDQLSFNYVARKQHFCFGHMINQFNINRNEYFKINSLHIGHK